MDGIKESQIVLADLRPDQDSFLEEVLTGLSKEQKELPCKYFYDERGSFLFENICTVDEYYIPQAEREIMQAAFKRSSTSLAAASSWWNTAAGIAGRRASYWKTCANWRLTFPSTSPGTSS